MSKPSAPRIPDWALDEWRNAIDFARAAYGDELPKDPEQMTLSELRRFISAKADEDRQHLQALEDRMKEAERKRDAARELVDLSNQIMSRMNEARVDPAGVMFEDAARTFLTPAEFARLVSAMRVLEPR